MSLDPWTCRDEHPAGDRVALDVFGAVHVGGPGGVGGLAGEHEHLGQALPGTRLAPPVTSGSHCPMPSNIPCGALSGSGAPSTIRELARVIQRLGSMLPSSVPVEPPGVTVANGRAARANSAADGRDHGGLQRRFVPGWSSVSPPIRSV